MTELPEEERIKLGAAVRALIGLGAPGDEGAKVGAEAGAQRIADKGDFGLSQEQIERIADRYQTVLQLDSCLLNTCGPRNSKRQREQTTVLCSQMVSSDLENS